jgi:hypothetical protein
MEWHDAVNLHRPRLAAMQELPVASITDCKPHRQKLATMVSYRPLCLSLLKNRCKSLTKLGAPPPLSIDMMKGTLNGVGYSIYRLILLWICKGLVYRDIGLVHIINLRSSIILMQPNRGEFARFQGDRQVVWRKMHVCKKTWEAIRHSPSSARSLRL